MMRRGWTVLVGGVLVALLSWVLTALPVPYVALGPGPTLDTLGNSDDGKEIIQIEGRQESKSKGHLNLTTVSVTDGLDLGSAMRYWLDGKYAVVPRELIFPPGESEEEVDKRNEADFKASQTSAEIAALRVLGYPVFVTVVKLTEKSPSERKLAVGDVITAVDGKPVTSNETLLKAISEVGPKGAVTVTYVRAGQSKSVLIGTTESDGRKVIGIQVESRQPHPFKVKFAIDKIGGPSAGLMFALGLVDKLKPEDLTGGQFIAGTGQINDDGEVLPIGGIQQKLVAADGVGASVFLTPADNCAEAVAAKPAGLRLIKIETLDGALKALDQLRTGKGKPPVCTR
jgi:PDZ domain-containing protein